VREFRGRDREVELYSLCHTIAKVYRLTGTLVISKSLERVKEEESVTACLAGNGATGYVFPSARPLQLVSINHNGYTQYSLYDRSCLYRCTKPQCQAEKGNGREQHLSIESMRQEELNSV
jgi:hypothetical protein